MPTLEVVNFNIVCATLGGFITLFGLVSYLLKEKYYLSEALISTIAGLIFSPHAANFIRPLDYANFNEVNLETITLYFTRLVLGVQLVLAGVQLPSKYLWKERKSLSLLLGPGMCIMWLITSMLVWALVPSLNILMALSIGACVTPTDPILSNSIVKGKFADKNIPPPLQKIIIAESGANDGLGYPFLYLGLYLLKYVHDGGAGQTGGAGKAIGYWFGETWGYEILLSVVYGAVVGWVAKDLLHWAEERRYVDRESFLVFAVTLALFIVGTCGMIGSDDVLACFIAGNAFTWDDWFRRETEDDSLQPTIDMLLNVAIFMWFGAVCPWHHFVANDVVPIYRLIPLGILVLLLRRLPMILALHFQIHQIEDLRLAGFMGFFGPIGVSAIFYLYVSREFLRDITVDGVQRQDAAHLAEALNVVIWFLAVCSIVVHGLSVPLGKLGFHLPRTISTALSSERVSRSRSESPELRREGRRGGSRDVRSASTRSLDREFRRRRPTSSELGPAPQRDFKTLLERLRGLVPGTRPTRSQQATDNDKAPGSADSSPNITHAGSHPKISGPRDGRVIGRPINTTPPTFIESDGRRESRDVDSPSPSRPHSARDNPSAKLPGSPASQAGLGLNTGGWQRTIRFPDEGPTPAQSQSRAPSPDATESRI